MGLFARKDINIMEEITRVLAEIFILLSMCLGIVLVLITFGIIINILYLFVQKSILTKNNQTTKENKD